VKKHTDEDVKRILREFADALMEHPVVRHADGKVWFGGVVRTTLKMFIKGLK